MNFADILLTILNELTTSDAIDPPAHWLSLITGAMAHCLLGAGLAWWHIPRRVCAGLLAAFVVKELCGDIPNGGYAIQVIADSVVDVSTAVAGWWIVAARWQRLGYEHNAA